MGGDLGGTAEDSPPKFEVEGKAHAFVPQYSEKYCYRMWGKVRTDKKGVKEEFCVLKSRFLVKKKGHIMLYRAPSAPSLFFKISKFSFEILEFKF